MKPKLFVHVGAAKCGSTAIQTFLRKNRKTLLHRGCAVPSMDFERFSRTTGEQVYFYKTLLSNENAPDVLAKKVHQLLDTVINKVEHPSIVTSAENLSNSAGPELFFKNLRDDFDIKIIAYIRRQDDFLMSSWQQWSLKKPIDFWSWLTRVVGNQGNWFARLEPWRELYGIENMTVRLFERDKLLKNDLLHDFCHLIGVDDGQLDFEVGTTNPSYSIAVQEFSDNAHHLFSNVHDHQFYEMIEDLTGSTFHKKSDQSFLTYNQRQAILLRYQQNNKKLKKIYFPNEDQSEPLFAPIKPTVTSSSSEQIQKEKEALIAHLIFELYKRTARPMSMTAKSIIKDKWLGKQ